MVRGRPLCMLLHGVGDASQHASTLTPRPTRSSCLSKPKPARPDMRWSVIAAPPLLRAEHCAGGEILYTEALGAPCTLGAPATRRSPVKGREGCGPPALRWPTAVLCGWRQSDLLGTRLKTENLAQATPRCTRGHLGYMAAAPDMLCPAAGRQPTCGERPFMAMALRALLHAHPCWRTDAPGTVRSPCMAPKESWSCRPTEPQPRTMKPRTTHPRRAKK